MKKLKTGKLLFLSCLFVSLVLHGGVLLFFFKAPLYLKQRWSSFWIGASDPANVLVLENNEELLKKVNHALEESFKDLLTSNRNSLKQNPSLVTGNPTQTSTAANKKCAAPLSPQDVASFDLEPVRSGSSLPYDLFELGDLEKSEGADIAEEFESLGVVANESKRQGLVDDFTLPPSHSEALPDSGQNSDSDKREEFAQFLQKHYEESAILEERSDLTEILEEKSPQSPAPYAHTNSVGHLLDEWVNKPLAETRLPQVEHYGISEIANSILWEEEIDVEIAFRSNDEGKYIFSLMIHPDFEIDAEPLQQNFYFIIDRSNSIKKFRFDGYKRAVQRALSALQEGDKFNIYILDKDLVRLSEKNLHFSAKTKKLAEEFLDIEQYKPFFSSNDLYESLSRLFPFTNASDEVHSAILISDGNTLLDSAKQRKAIFRWTQKNKGKFNLYTASAGQGNNLVLLDLLSYTTSGKMVYSDTHASFPRKLVKLVKDLHQPMIKEVTVDAVSKDPGNNVSIFPTKVLLPPLYQKKAFSVVGTIDDITDFTLYIQGQNRGRWLNIRKTLSFKDAVKGGRSLDKLWAHTQANNHYDEFLKEGKISHLNEAKTILAPFKDVICLD